jgi:transposase
VKGKVVRPQKITYELIYKICEDIARGFSYDQAALNNGISASTFFRWMRKGKELDAEQIYKDLVRLVDVASEFSEAEALQLIRSEAIMSRNWKASAWFLERRFPEKYGKKNITDLKKEEESNE